MHDCVSNKCTYNLKKDATYLLNSVTCVIYDTQSYMSFCLCCCCAHSWVECCCCAHPLMSGVVLLLCSSLSIHVIHVFLFVLLLCSSMSGVLLLCSFRKTPMSGWAQQQHNSTHGWMSTAAALHSSMSTAAALHSWMSTAAAQTKRHVWHSTHGWAQQQHSTHGWAQQQHNSTHGRMSTGLAAFARHNKACCALSCGKMSVDLSGNLWR